MYYLDLDKKHKNGGINIYEFHINIRGLEQSNLKVFKTNITPYSW